MVIKIAIVTPSFNQRIYLDQCIKSVLEQNYEGLCYYVIDGGSIDGSREILEKYRSQLNGLTIKSDEGQYDAINKGFRDALAASNAEVMGWLNSDDIMLNGALKSVGEIFESFPDVEWISCLLRARSSHNGLIDGITSLPGLSREAFHHNRYLPAADPYSSFGFIQQESTFWRRSLWERAGGYLSTSHGMAGDYELWHRFYQHSHCVGVSIPLALNRVHHRQQSANIDRYNSNAASLIKPIPNRHRARAAMLKRLRRHGLAELPALKQRLAKTFGYRGQRIVLENPEGPNSNWQLEEHWFL